MDASYGIIPLQLIEGTWKVFVIQRDQGFWEFPKGHAEPGETDMQAASRELDEETGLYVKNLLFNEPFEFFYEFTQEQKVIKKRARYFLAEVQGTTRLHPNEVLDGKWVPLDKADEILTFDNSREMLREVRRKLQVID